MESGRTVVQDVAGWGVGQSFSNNRMKKIYFLHLLSLFLSSYFFYLVYKYF